MPTRKREGRNPDQLVVQIWLTMLGDFRNATGDHTLLTRHAELLRKGDLDGFRREPWPSRFQSPPYMFKCLYQCEAFFKRYIFERDASASLNLSQKAVTSFLKYQEDISRPRQCYKLSTCSIIRKARSIVKEILGPYDEDEVIDNAMFGKRANVNVPYTDSYLDRKVEVLTGSTEHIRWFSQTIIPRDKILADSLSEIGKTDLTPEYVETLKLVTVPKAYDTERTIMPNTVIGAFHSEGLGRCIEQKLREHGLDIRRLQERHSRLVKKYSINRSHVTADLKRASDWFSSATVNMLVPRKWFNALKLGRISQVEYSNQRYYCHSFMAMGIGYTFPLQTLLFYALLKAIAELTRVEGLISVYGDDLIYPRKMHAYVVRVFDDLGIILNKDKTFVETHFRESCGSDYYKGVDVRPYRPQWVGGRLGVIRYEAFLYKLYNGLQRRWLDVEIPRTFYLLRREIAAVAGRINQVPMSYPDFSGVKVDAPKRATVQYPWSPVYWNRGVYNFRFLEEYSASDRIVRIVYPYYWFSLRQLTKLRGSDYRLEGPAIRTLSGEYESPFDQPTLKWQAVGTKKERNGVLKLMRKAKRSKDSKESRRLQKLFDKLNQRAHFIASKTDIKLRQAGSDVSVWTGHALRV